MSLIELKGVTKNFVIGNLEENILKSTDLDIDRGQFIAIVGPSGSGKSTLLTIIGALQKPTLGEIKIDGKSLNVMNSKELATLRFESLGFVLQTSNLVPYLTIYEQFELKFKYGNRKVDDERIEYILDKFSIGHIKDKYPEDISGGERQRAAIGNALLLSPKIILADEPTASLDTEKAYQVVDIFKEISREEGTTIIIVTHDVRMLSNCDKVLEMRDGVLKLLA